MRLLVAFVALCCANPLVPEAGAQLRTCTRPPLLVEGREATLCVVAAEVGPALPQARVRVVDAAGHAVLDTAVTLTRQDANLVGAASWNPPANGLYTMEASWQGEQTSMNLPVLSPSRDLDFAWYSYRPWMRWVTVVASSNEGNRDELRSRGVKGLRWRAGPPRTPDHGDVERTRLEGARYLAVPEGFDFDGYGIDEFGGYPGTERERHGHAWVQGLIDARAAFPPGFYVAGWHSGGVRDEAVGLYKQALDLLLIEA